MTMPAVKPAPNGLNENRKASKPLIEKRRRARINSSLAQLKSMVVDTVTQNQTPNGKPPKLEKADILEMTVAHLKRMHHSIMKVPEEDKYIAGFSFCVKEVRQFIENNIDKDSKLQLLNYLNYIANKITPASPGTSPTPDLETGMDDSSCSSNSRSETPSSTFTELSPVDYRSYSPYSENQPDSSTASRTFVSENRTRVDDCKWIPDSSVNRMPRPNCAPNSTPNGHEIKQISNGFGPANFAAHYYESGNSFSNVSPQPNYANAVNQVHEGNAYHVQQEMHNMNQDMNGFVWRPW